VSDRVKRELTFADGIGVGIGSLMILPLIYFAAYRADFVGLYASSKIQLPAITTVVLHPAWSFGVPIALVVGFGVAIHQRPARLVIFGIGLLALALSILTYAGAYRPVFALAGNIR
jgi:hypothetical protein